MRRREFIAGIGTAAMMPLVEAKAQQAGVPTVGFLHSGSPELSPNLVAGFRKGLREMGYVEGQNVAIEFRWGYNNNDRMQELVADLVRQRAAVIATPNSGLAALAVKAATATIPIVFNTPFDPVQAGLVANLSRPGGNATGFINMAGELGSKRLTLLRELRPKAVRFAVLIDPQTDNPESTIAELRTAALALGLQIDVFAAGTIRDIDAAFANIVGSKADALLLTPSALFGARRIQFATLAARHTLPVLYHDRIFTEAGGLMSYGASFVDSYRQVGIYVGRILKGEKPADLPIQQPTKFEFVINLQAARTIGLEVPPSLLALADEVIE